MPSSRPRAIAIGAGALLLGLLVLAVLGVRSCAQEPVAPGAPVESARDAALVGVAAEGNAVIEVYGSHTGARGPDATTIQVENLIKAAFQQWADPNSFFIPIATASPPWITGTGNTGAPKGDGTADTLISPDGSHPNDAGHKVIADKAVAASRAIYAAV